MKNVVVNDSLAKGKKKKGMYSSLALMMGLVMTVVDTMRADVMGEGATGADKVIGNRSDDHSCW